VDLREGLHWVSEFLQNPASLKVPHARARGLNAQANYLWLIQQFHAARVAGEESLELFRACDDREGEYGALGTLAGIYQFLEGMDKRIGFLFQALELARSLGDLAREASILDGLGWDRRDPQRSKQYWDEAVRLYRQIGDWRNLQFLLGIYGDTLLANGEVDAAHRLMDEALALDERIHHKRGLEFVFVAKSREALLAGEFAQARAYLEEWLEVAENMGNRMGYLWGRARLGNVVLRSGNLEEGSQILSEMAREFHADQNKSGLAYALERLSHLFVLSNLEERAARVIGWADKARKETGDVRPKLEQEDVDRDLAVCVSRLGEEAVAQARKNGCNMTMDDIVALALENS
jgi:tetratricopeptide (TPR) repeat protein